MTNQYAPRVSRLPRRLEPGLLLGGRNPRLRNRILLLWIASALISVLLGLATIEYEWSALTFSLGSHTLNITLYPPLILSMFWLIWFGFWWAAIPAWLSTFILATHYGMPYEWALFFACSDPLGLALIAMIYRAQPHATQFRKPTNLALFILISFAAAVLSSVGAFIWSHATHADISSLYNVWEGWWLGFWLQNVAVVLPILLLASPYISHWQQDSRLWSGHPPGREGLNMTLGIAATLVATAMLFTWCSASLTKDAIKTAAFSRDAHIWQPIALMVQESVDALMTVLLTLLVAMSLFGIYLFRYWSRRLTLSNQLLTRSNRQLNAEIQERKNIQIELQARYQMLNLMAELDARLHAARSAQDIIAALTEYLPRQLPRLEGVLCRVTQDRRLNILTHWGRFALMGDEHATSIELPTSPDRWGLPALYDPDGIRNIHQVLPLRSGNNLLGVILLGPSPRHDSLVSSVLQILSEHLSLALTNLHLREQLIEEASHDPLTGLYNRRYLHNWLGHELARSDRHGRSLGLMLIDIDHFKQINDHFGHEAGDLALQGIAAFILQQIRESDIACRFGGEEIILALPEASLFHAQERATDLLQGIRSLSLRTHSGTPLPELTVSIGLAAYPQHAHNADSLIRVADQAMYRAKAAGRNRIMIAHEAAELARFPPLA
ncbi:GGDEF domain-containing protein [Marinobacterium marinum]|uniref:diguanylate cyclase n=1 Tax=Marinobacterium marinum TaxID=2756129 RepID=A0A7W1WY53_9GAMM|nr:GGDEF domain-containing protein [Marinobacterium marinum]MBA4502404.1 GGDEF domain-containing protein [Marinobacterium marinum]